MLIVVIDYCADHFLNKSINHLSLKYKEIVKTVGEAGTRECFTTNEAFHRLEKTVSNVH